MSLPTDAALAELLAEDRSAAQLLGVLAQLGDAAVPGWLLAAEPDALPGPLAECARAGAAAVLAAARPLEERGWAETNEEGLRLPGPVAEAVRGRMSGRERGVYLRAAAALLHAAFPERVGRPELRDRCRALEPHVWAVSGRVGGGGRSTAEAVHLLGRLGAFHRSEGEAESSLEAFRAARRVARSGEPVGPVLLAVLADEEANALAALGRREEALEAAEALVTATRGRIEPEDPRHPLLLSNAAALLREGGRAGRAAEVLEFALRALEEAGSPAARPLEAELSADRADALLAAGRAEEAAAAAAEAGERARALEAGGDAEAGPHVIRADWIRADALREAGRPEEATELFRRALEAERRALGPRHPEVGQKALALARHLEELGDPSGAAELYESALRAFEASVGATSEPAEAARAGLARAGGSPGAD